MKMKFSYLGSGDNREDFNKLIEEREVKDGLDEEIIGRFKECMDGNKYVGINCYYEKGKFYGNGEGINLKDKNMEYFSLLLILCENIEGIGFRGCGIDGEMMKMISESFIFMENLKEINLAGNTEYKIDNYISDAGFASIVQNIYQI